MDASYWWHNLPLVRPDLLRFHYPFKPEYGDSPSYCLGLAGEYLGESVVELGCGTGWLRDAWGIKNYTGVERNAFGEPFQERAREEALRNRVVHLGIADFIATATRPYQSVVCFESFHEFPVEALGGIRGKLLSAGGTAVIVDARRWWPSGLALEEDGLQCVLDHEIPPNYFDYEAIARVSLDLFEALLREVQSYTRVLEIAEYNMQPELFHPLRRGVSVEALRAQLDSMDLMPPDLCYSVIVLRRTS